MDLLGRKAKRQLDEYVLLAAAYVKLLQSKEYEMRNRITLITIENDNLKQRLEEAGKRTAPPIKSQPLYLNENEEDIEYAYRNELINKEQYEDMLKQLEFDNTNITFDLEAY